MVDPVEKYQPGSGTEGAAFIEGWCSRCARSGAPGRPNDAGDEIVGCSITGLTMAFDPADAEYPTEWRYQDGQPICTAFVVEGDPVPPPRCTRTLDLFAAAAP